MFEHYTDIQPVADRLKALAYRLDANPKKRQAVFDSITRLEGVQWHPDAMNDVLERIEPHRLHIDEDEHLHLERVGSEPISHIAVLHYLIEAYIEKLRGEPTILGTDEAATYLGLTVRGLKRQMYEQKAIEGMTIGKTLVFTLGQLYEFDLIPRKVGRPKGSKVVEGDKSR